jgi:5-methylcytosine-specific restriction endonuclease McrA
MNSPRPNTSHPQHSAKPNSASEPKLNSKKTLAPANTSNLSGNYRCYNNSRCSPVFPNTIAPDKSKARQRLTKKKSNRCPGATKSERLLKRRTASIYFSQKRRAAKAGQALDYNLDNYRQIIPTLPTPCRYCHRPMTIKNHSADHAWPIARGGSWSLCNIEITCRSCNTAKGIMTPHEYRSLLALLQTFPDIVRINTLARLKAGSQYAKSC